jgi:hypothetical protein
MTVTRRRQSSSIKPRRGRTDRLLDPTAQAVPAPHPTEETVREATIQALQTLLHILKIAPAGHVEVPALQRRLFQVTAPRSGFTITVPNPRALSEPVTLTATPDVQWEVLNEQGNALAPDEGFMADPPALNALREQICFFPPIVKDEYNVPDSVAFTLRAAVRLTATDPTTGAAITVPPHGRADLPPLTVYVPVALRVPAILALFGHPNFAPQAGATPGGALVFVPPGSRIAAVADLADDGALGTLLDKVGALRAAIEGLPVAQQSRLATLAGDLEGFLDGLHALASNLARFGRPAAGPVTLRLAASSPNLQRVPGLLNEAGGASAIRSLIVIGLAQTVRFYNTSQFRAGQSTLQIETGPQMCTVLAHLDRAQPSAAIGDPTITTPEPATFDNTIASFHFGQHPPL